VRRNSNERKWEKAADLICAILTFSKENSQSLEEEAAMRGISLEQLLAAAIAGALREEVFRDR
jgi:hypothetical protein